MASFAKIGLNNKVIAVHSVHNDILKDADGVEQENIGIDFLTKLTGWAIWKQTSYNTIGGVHKLGGTPFRKNYAGKGSYYDDTRDAFIAPCGHASWTLNEETCGYEAPIPYPNDGSIWNEATQSWDL